MKTTVAGFDYLNLFSAPAAAAEVIARLAADGWEHRLTARKQIGGVAVVALMFRRPEADPGRPGMPSGRAGGHRP